MYLSCFAEKVAARELALLLCLLHICKPLLFCGSGLITYMGASSELHFVVHNSQLNTEEPQNQRLTANAQSLHGTFQITGLGESLWRPLQERQEGVGGREAGKGQVL